MDKKEVEKEKEEESGDKKEEEKEKEKGEPKEEEKLKEDKIKEKGEKTNKLIEKLESIDNIDFDYKTSLKLNLIHLFLILGFIFN